jgi:hypothetical protein
MLAGLVERLSKRDACLYHACQLQDLSSYLKLGGIPSRAHLEAHQSRYTSMDTDATDHVNDVWDKAFVNLDDFGRAFATGYSATPNVFGPINIQLHPDALLECKDVAVCLRSAGAQGFDRNRESLKRMDDIDFLFRHPADTLFPKRSMLKTAKELQEVFPNAHLPELSCTAPSGCLTFEHTVVIWVDPHIINDRPLVEWVKKIVIHYNLDVPVVERTCISERRLVYRELAELASPRPTTLDELMTRPETSAELRSLAQELRQRQLDYQFSRYLRYLHRGTLAVDSAMAQ